MSSTFTLPLRLNTRQTTSNDGTISPDTTGAAVISQQVNTTNTAPGIIIIPAGSIIHFVSYITDNPTNTLMNLILDGATIGTIGDANEVNTATLTSSDVANTGPTATVLTHQAAFPADGVFSVVYTGRNADGTITAYGSGYTNN
jgi:hypothetical protein